MREFKVGDLVFCTNKDTIEDYPELATPQRVVSVEMSRPVFYRPHDPAVPLIYLNVLDGGEVLPISFYGDDLQHWDMGETPNLPEWF